MIADRGIGMTSQRTRDRLVQRLQEAGIRDSRVLRVIGDIPRHAFVDEALASRAYEDTALPIGHGQTISQPYMVARMTEAILAEQLPSKVLEVGTGSGYQTAVLARLVQQVYSVERIGALLERARRQLRALHLTNVRYRHSDGSWGWAEQGPFDAILVAAAAEEIPDALLEQLAEGGRLVMPVGTRQGQQLHLAVRRGANVEVGVLERASFVPLLGGAG